MANSLYSVEFLTEVNDVKSVTRNGVIQVTIGYMWNWYKPFLYLRVGRLTFHFGWFLTTKCSSEAEEDETA